jgi:LmbE family N-acetylglucosaminyl deacetylase
MLDFKNKKIIVVIAHPDDETIGCGGLISKAARLGAEVKVILPLKRRNQRTESDWGEEIKEFKDACALLGAAPVLLEHLVVDDYIELKVEEIANKLAEYVSWADLIFCHHFNDIHHAHQAISKAVEIATRPFRINKTVFCFEILTSTDQGFESGFKPNCYVVLGEEDAAKKENAMKLYKTENVRGRTSKNLNNLMKYRGGQIGTNFAEAFQIVRFYI